jgi:cytochrome c
MPERPVRHKLVVAAIANGTLALAAASAAAQEGPGLGVEATPEQVAAWTLTVLPDGTGLPPGSGSARAGEAIYAQKCLACHGAEGKDGPNDRLAGGHGTLTDAAPVKTIGSYWPYATTVFDYIRRAMPFTQPQSLSADETYALTAYLLYLNEIVGRDDRIDARSFPAIEMPNVENFFRAFKAP